MRKAGIVLLFLVVLCAAGWSCLWFYASREAAARTDAWIAAERTQGRQWTCPNRQVAGFPFSLAIDCDKPTFVGQASGQRVEATLAHLTGKLAFSHPREVGITLVAPFGFRTSDGGTNVQGTWQSISVDLSALPEIRTVALRGSNIAVGGTFVGSPRQGGKTDTLEARFTLSPDQTDPTVMFDITLKGAVVPPLDNLLGGSAPVDAGLVGRLDRADIGHARTPQQAMELWRQAGGRVDIDRSVATRAGASVSATGTLRLDEAHRVNGHLDAEFVGMEQILRRYGISGNLAAVGSLVSALFGGGGARKAPAAPGALDLPIVFNNGRLGIGPITTPVTLSPLY